MTTTTHDHGEMKLHVVINYSFLLLIYKILPIKLTKEITGNYQHTSHLTSRTSRSQNIN